MDSLPCLPDHLGTSPQFSFASFSEASTAVVFIAKLVDLIMETPIELHYKKAVKIFGLHFTNLVMDGANNEKEMEKVNLVCLCLIYME